MALSRVTVWYNHHHHPSAWLFITANKLCTLKDNSPLPLPTAPGCLCSARVSLWIWAESHSICLSASGFFHLAQRLQGVSVSRHESAFLSSLVSMVMSPCTCRPRFVYPVISCERLSCFHLLVLWLMLFWTSVYKYLFTLLLSVRLGVYSEVDLLDYMVIQHLIFKRFSTTAVPFYILAFAQKAPVAPHPCKHLVFLCVCVFFLIVAA